MKNLLAVVVVVLFYNAVSAQSLLNSMKKKLKQEEQQLLNQKKNQAQNPTAPNQNQNPNQPGQPNQPDQPQAQAQGQQSQPQPTSLKVYSNYDFVPGEKILFEDNFSGEQDGEFPSKWDLEHGQALLNKVNGDLAFFIIEGNYAIVTPRLTESSYLTDPFTVELDYFIQREHPRGIHVFFMCADKRRVGIEFGERGQVSTSYFPREFSNNFPGEEDLAGKWHHAAIIFKNGQMKCYVDQYRVLILPNTQITPVSVKFGGIGGQDAPIIFKNIKIASGGSMNMTGKKFTDAKIVTHGINFDVGKSIIRPESMGTLNMVKQVMVDNPEIKFEIDGHTDSDGDPATNLKLSEDRANAVQAALIDLGVDASRLTTKGFGQTKPLSDNNSAEGKANNRRVEFIKQ